MSKWQDAQQRFGQLQQREKVMILAVSLFCVIYLSVWFVIMPMFQKQADFNKQAVNLEREIAVIDTQQQALRQALSIDYKAKVREKIAEQELQITTLDLQLQQLSQGFIAAENMPKVLSELLAEHSGLQLTSFKVIGVEPVLANTNPSANTNENIDENTVERVLYRHNMELKVSGDYFAAKAYMQKIEQAPLRVLITGFHYHVDEYPKGELTLNLATVSSNDTFIIL
ncbi:hypothetical protein [Pseudoalteromonas pernae]|uniref:hypothetical protein n=1 Tax=Pseudoalteromonas pernae TaxID=3118054 RepID=UPI003242BCCB